MSAFVIEESGNTLTPEEFDLLLGLYAYEVGDTDAGIHDPTRRAALMEKIDAMDPDALRLALSRGLRDRYLTEEAMAQGYGWEDVHAFGEWFEDSDGSYRSLG